MALTRPSQNNIPEPPPEGMRWVWHAAGAEWVLDAVLPQPKRTLWERVRPEWGLHRDPVNRPAKVLTWAGFILGGPLMIACAFATVAVLAGAWWVFHAILPGIG